MAEVQPRFCPHCSTPMVAGQRFCARCGLLTTDFSSKPSLPNQQQQNSTHEHEFQREQQGPSASASPLPPSQTPLPVPVATPASSVNKRSFSRAGCALLLLGLLLLLGSISYYGVAVLGWHLPGIGDQIQLPITTMPIGSTLTYTGMSITVINAQQSQSFVDDPKTSTMGMVRLHLSEKNSTSIPIHWSYDESAQLILPGGKAVLPTYVNAQVSVAPGGTQTSMVDFAVPSSVSVGQLTLQLGTVQEAQLDVPLTGKADLTQYQPKMFNINGHLQYMGLDWNLVSATTQLSVPSQQASKGMQYLLVTLNVDNTLSQTAIVGSAYDYVRLQFGSTTVSPTHTTLPVSFEMGATATMGTVTFLIPQNGTAFTLILLPQSQSGADQATRDFQLQ